MHEVFLGQSLRKFNVQRWGPNQLNRCEVTAESSLSTCSYLCSHISWYNAIGVLLPCGWRWITFWKNSHWKKERRKFKVQLRKTAWRSQSRAHGKAYEQVPALICDTYAHCILYAATIWGGYFAHREQNNPPKYLGNKSEIPHLNFTNPLIISAFNSKWGTPPFRSLRFPMKLQPIPLGFSNAVSKLKAQSSIVSFATFQWKETFELWALSFETASENVTLRGIECIWTMKGTAKAIATNSVSFDDSTSCSSCWG